MSRKQQITDEDIAACAKQWARRLNRLQDNYVAAGRKKQRALFAWGTGFLKAKDAIKHGDWLRWLRDPARVGTPIRIGVSYAERLMAVAWFLRRVKSATWRNLPDAERPLYELSRLFDLHEELFWAALKGGDIHCDVTAEEVRALRPETPINGLAADIKFVTGFTSRRDIVPSMTHVFLSNGTVRAYNGVAGAIWSTPEIGEEFAVPGAELAQCLAALPNREVAFSATEESVSIRAGTFEAALRPLPVSAEIPPELSLQAPKDGVSLTTQFWADLATIKPTVCQDETHHGLRGVYWAPDGTLISTDRFRITIVRPPSDAAVRCPVDKGLLIPDYLLELLGDRRAEFTKAELDENRLWLLHDRGAVHARLLDAEFPADLVLPLLKTARAAAATKGTTVTLPRGTDRVLDRFLLFVDHPYHRLRVEVTNDAVRFVAEDSDDGDRAEETVAADVVGPAATFWVNGEFLKDALRRISWTFWCAPDAPMYITNGRVEFLMTLLPPRDVAVSADEGELVPEPNQIEPEWRRDEEEERRAVRMILDDAVWRADCRAQRAVVNEALVAIVEERRAAAATSAPAAAS